MNIVFIDDSKLFLKTIEIYLKTIGIKEFKLFDNPIEFLNYFEKNMVDIVFIDFYMPQMSGLEVLKKIRSKSKDIVTVMLTSIKDEELKEKAIQEGVNDFLYKNISFVEFKAKLQMLINLREYFLEKSHKEDQLSSIVKYKETQEKEAILKQYKIIKNQLAMFFEDDFLSESFFQSIDILNGDSIVTKRIDKNKYFYAIIDAMGKGLSASITALNATSFLDYSISRAMEANDFNFKRNINDFVKYVKSILLEEETLSANIIYIENNKVYIANFGMPPIYTDKEKIIANNLPIRINTNKINIDEIEFSNKILFFSDGILESTLKNDNKIYLKRFKEIQQNIQFLKDLTKDFKKSANQQDDITAILIQKDNFKTEKIFSIEKILHSLDDINEVLESIYKVPIKEASKIHFMFQELLMNTYEHNMITLSKDKEDLIKENKLEKEKIKKPVKVKIEIFISEKIVKILFFEENKLLNLETLEALRYKKYHGRGLKIVASLSDALFMSNDMQYIKIFIRRDSEN